MVDETEADMNVDEMLDYLCWQAAFSAHNAYEYLERYEDGEIFDEFEDAGVDDPTVASEKEMIAVSTSFNRWFDMFQLMELHGFDPRARADRYVVDSDIDYSELDWEWYDEQYAFDSGE